MEASQSSTIGFIYDTKIADIILILIRLIANFLIAAALPYRQSFSLAFMVLFLLFSDLDIFVT